MRVEWFIFTAFLALLPLQNVFADAALYLYPQTGDYRVGELFDVYVYADTGAKAVNAAEADLTFNNIGLEVEDVSVDGSILNTWSTEPSFSNEEGTIRFSGWTNVKYSGKKGLLITITFKALRAMQADARLISGAILAADPQESNIITEMRSGIYGIGVGEASSPLPEASQESPASAPANELRVPTWGEYSSVTKSGDYIDIRGKTSPNTTVHLWFQKGDAEPSLSDTLSDASGNFTFFSETPVDAGTYHIWATALRNGSESARSQIATVKVENVGLVAAAQTGADFIATMIPFLAATVLAGLGIGYVFHRKKMEEKAPLR